MWNGKRIIKAWPAAGSIQMPSLRNAVQNGYGREYVPFCDCALWRAAFAEFGLDPAAEESYYGNFLGHHFLDGAFTHKHQDAAPEGMVHARCNVMLRKPPIGGNPILDGVELDVVEGDLWLCLASRELHSSTPIHGGERFIFSFGALVPISQF